MGYGVAQFKVLFNSQESQFFTLKPKPNPKLSHTVYTAFYEHLGSY